MEYRCCGRRMGQHGVEVVSTVAAQQEATGQPGPCVRCPCTCVGSLWVLKSHGPKTLTGDSKLFIVVNVSIKCCLCVC